MKQLKVKDLKMILETMPDNAVVYLGDDEELNGLHGAYFCQKVSKGMVMDTSYGRYEKSGVLIS